MHLDTFEMALSGSNFFKITKGLLLKVLYNVFQ